MSNKKNHQENHGHNCESHEHNHTYAHDNCENHDHEHDHGHEHDHDHSNCGHNHSHGHSEEHTRHSFSPHELQTFKDLSMEKLMQQADDFLTEEQFGKVVPIFEIAYEKMQSAGLQDEESALDLVNIKQNLAFSYGIIGEHLKAIPLWKNVIEYKEQSSGDVTDLLDDYFGIALSCEQCELEDDFLLYIEKGLKLARENKFDEYVASFEHELGGFYCDKSEFAKAENYLRSAIKIREKLADIVGLAMTKMYMGILFEEQNKISDARQFYESALELTKDEDYCDELTGERAEIELRLSQIQNSNLKSKLLNI